MVAIKSKQQSIRPEFCHVTLAGKSKSAVAGTEWRPRFVPPAYQRNLNDARDDDGGRDDHCHHPAGSYRDPRPCRGSSDHPCRPDLLLLRGSDSRANLRYRTDGSLARFRPE